MVLGVGLEADVIVAVGAFEIKPEYLDAEIILLIADLHPHIELGADVEIVMAHIAAKRHGQHVAHHHQFIPSSASFHQQLGIEVLGNVLYQNLPVRHPLLLQIIIQFRLLFKNITMENHPASSSRNLSQNQQINSQAPVYVRMDALFYRAIVKLKNTQKCWIIYEILKTLIMLLFLPIDITVLHSPNKFILAMLAISLTKSFLNFLLNVVSFRMFLSDSSQNNVFFLQIAQEANHVILFDRIKNGEDLKCLQKCVSQRIYSATSAILVDDERIETRVRKHYEKVFARLIQNEIEGSHPLYKCLVYFSKVFSVFIVGFGIIALNVDEPNTPEIVILILFMALQAWNVSFFFIMLLIVALSPLLCLLICIYYACCVKDKIERENVELPHPQKATIDLIKETNGSCSICFQDFLPDQRVIILPCSTAHMFHEGCLDKWMNISLTCPLCRFKLIPQAPQPTS